MPKFRRVDAAKNLSRRMGDGVEFHLTHVAASLQKCGGCVEMHRLLMDPAILMAWLVERLYGVYLVVFVQNQLLDHCVVLSCSQRFIVDSAGINQLKLIKIVLRFLGGDEGVSLLVKDVREVVFQEEFLNPNNNKLKKFVKLVQ